MEPELIMAVGTVLSNLITGWAAFKFGARKHDRQDSALTHKQGMEADGALGTNYKALFDQVNLQFAGIAEQYAGWIELHKKNVAELTMNLIEARTKEGMANEKVKALEAENKALRKRRTVLGGREKAADLGGGRLADSPPSAV